MNEAYIAFLEDMIEQQNRMINHLLEILKGESNADRTDRKEH